MRILVIEDNPALSELLVRLLSNQSFAVDAAATVDDASAALSVASYDLVLLDLSLPDGDGASILRALRRRAVAVPVLVATARTDVVHRVRTLDLGADDYLVKPFSSEELLARVRALLRRPHHALAPIIAVGNVALDTTLPSVMVGGEPVDMPRREVTVLAALLRNPGQLVSRRTLEAAVNTFDAEVTPNAIEAAISRVRRRLGSHGASIAITSMRGLGYILAEKVPA